jgi:hypothetical protein
VFDRREPSRIAPAASHPAPRLGELARSIGTGRVPRSIDALGERRVVEIYGDARETAVVVATRPSGIVRRPAWAEWVAEEHAGAPDGIERRVDTSRASGQIFSSIECPSAKRDPRSKM